VEECDLLGRELEYLVLVAEEWVTGCHRIRDKEDQLGILVSHQGIGWIRRDAMAVVGFSPCCA